MMRSWCFAILLGSMAVGGPAAAQSRAEASAGLQIQRGLNISAASPMQFQAGSSARGAATPGDTPAVIVVSGDPGRLYRLRLPQFVSAPGGGALIEMLEVRSRSSGDISKSRVGRIDGSGSDILTIRGRLMGRMASEAKVTLAIPMSLDYD